MHPQTIGPFRVAQRLSSGGMGRVYRAVDTRNGREVALKVVDVGADRESQEVMAAERLGAVLQERLGALEPRIPRIFAHGEDPGCFYIAMEYVPGEDLSEVLRQMRVGFPFALRIGSDLCEVLAQAHGFRTAIDGREIRGVVHGDIKPRNIRITPEGGVRVLDFGIAKALTMTRTHTHNLFGSVQYSSPERLREGVVDQHSDLWSVAVVLYEVLTGKPYFQAENSPKLDHLIRHYRELQPLPPEWPAPLKGLMARALHPDIHQRHRNAMEFAAEMNAVRTELLGTAPPAGVDERTRRTGPAATPVDESEATRRSGPAGAGPVSVGVIPPPLPASRPEAPTGPMPDPTPVGAYRSADEFAAAVEQRKQEQLAAVLGTGAPRAEATKRTGGAPPATPRLRLRLRPFHWSKAKVAGAALGLLVTAGLLANEVVYWRRSGDLADDLRSERLKDMEVAWKRYSDLQSGAALPLTTGPARNALRERLLAAADRVILEYRNAESPTVGTESWRRCQAAAARALELLPNDREVRGRVRLCEAQQERIRGASLRDKTMLNSAQNKFQQAAELMPQSPDPYLGLARMYVYNLRDVDKAEDSLKEAGKRHFQTGRRETSQLADGYLYRGERLLAEVRKATTEHEWDELLDRARSDLRRAQELYESIVPYGGSVASLRKAMADLELLEGMRDVGYVGPEGTR